MSLVEADAIEWDTLWAFQDERRNYGEVRMIGFAYIGPRLHCVVYTDRADGRRIISLRKRPIRERRSAMPSLKPDHISPTPEEDAAIDAGIAADPDTVELSDADVAKLRPVRRGRPPLPSAKRAIKLRLDPDVIDGFRAGGAGWQSRINRALRQALGLSDPS